MPFGFFYFIWFSFFFQELRIDAYPWVIVITNISTLLFIAQITPNEINERSHNTKTWTKRVVCVCLVGFFFRYYLAIEFAGANYGHCNMHWYNKWKRIYGVEKFMIEKWFCNWGSDLQCIFSHNLFVSAKGKLGAIKFELQE